MADAPSFCPASFASALLAERSTPPARARDATTLATLSAEGRTSATSIIAARTLRFMHEARAHVPQERRKLLAFTDNRQDAALQAGHFNDFAFVTLFRAAILHSLQDAPVGLTDLARRATLRLGFVKANEGLRPHWLRDTTWQGRRLDEAHRVFEETMALRIVQDFRNTWRCTNPNLMRLKLLQVEFAGLSDLVNDQRAFGALATIGQKPNDYGAYAAKGDPIWREKVLVLLLKDMLTGFAIDDE